MAIHLPSPRQVQTAGVGDHADGGGLVLKVHDGRARWLLRFTNLAGQRRALGLGAAHRDSLAMAGKSLSSARESADKARRLLQDDTDPIEAKAQARDKARKAAEEKKAAAKCERATLARVARAYHERVIEGSRSPKHAAQWIASLEANVPPELWQKPIAEVTAQELLAALIGLQARIPETASRVRQRLDAIFEDAVFHGLAAANPAATIRRKLREAKGRRVRGQFQALAYGEAPALVARLRQMEGIAARALEFAILTASRTSEVLGATWAEFDAALWTVPAGRMKAREAGSGGVQPCAIRRRAPKAPRRVGGVSRRASASEQRDSVGGREGGVTSFDSIDGLIDAFEIAIERHAAGPSVSREDPPPRVSPRSAAAR
jgi:integrase